MRSIRILISVFISVMMLTSCDTPEPAVPGNEPQEQEQEEPQEQQEEPAPENPAPEDPAPEDPGRQTESFALRLMTFNILQGGKADGSTDEEGHEWKTVRKAPCMKMFKEVDPDIIMLQECRKEQLNDIKAELKDYSYYSYAKDGVLAASYTDGDAANDASFKNKGQRNVIMLRTSQYEVKDWGRFWLSDTPDVPSNGFGTEGKKLTLWLKVQHKASGVEFYLFNTHFIPQSYGNAVDPVVDVISPCARVNIEQMKKVLGDSTQSGKGESKTTVFFAGDLNCNNENSRMSAVNDYMLHAGVEATKTDMSMTFNGFREDSSTWTRIDHIYYKNASPKLYKVVSEASYGTQFISDHFPVYSDFDITYEVSK